MEIITRKFNGLTIGQRKSDGYINLNQLADASGKRIDNWKRLKETTSLLREFSSSLEYQGIQPLVEIEGRNGGTWAHPDIAIQFAQWCSSAFALQVSRWVREWMMTTRENPIPIEPPAVNQTQEVDSVVKPAIALERTCRILSEAARTHGTQAGIAASLLVTGDASAIHPAIPRVYFSTSYSKRRM